MLLKPPPDREKVKLKCLGGTFSSMAQAIWMAVRQQARTDSLTSPAEHAGTGGEEEGGGGGVCQAERRRSRRCVRQCGCETRTVRCRGRTSLLFATLTLDRDLVASILGW